MDELDQDPSGGLTRRDVVKRGAVVGGALVWSTPVVQALSVRVADAASGPGGGGGGEEPPPDPVEPVILGELPSHGLFVVSVNGTKYGYQVSDMGALGSLGSQDTTYLAAQGVGTYVMKDEVSKGGGKKGGTPAVADTSWSTLLGQIVATNDALYTAADGTIYRAIAVTLPTGVAVAEAAAYIFDGSFQKDPDGDKFRDAKVVANVIYFIKP